MLGDIVELSVVVRNLDEAAGCFRRLFGLKVQHRGESKQLGFKNAILPTGIGHIELMEPTDPDKAGPEAGSSGQSRAHPGVTPRRRAAPRSRARFDREGGPLGARRRPLRSR